MHSQAARDREIEPEPVVRERTDRIGDEQWRVRGRG